MMGILDVLNLWHVHRIPIILTTFFVLLAVRFAAGSKFAREKAVFTPADQIPLIPTTKEIGRAHV